MRMFTVCQWLALSMIYLFQRGHCEQHPGFASEVIVVDEYEQTTPSLRKRRSSSDETHKQLPKDIYYELTAFNNTFLLSLRQDSSFVAPSLIIQRSNDSRIESYEQWLRDITEQPSGCHYIGSVNKNSQDVAHANLCHTNGLAASFISGEHEYHVEPLGGPLNQSAHHLVKRFKRSSPLNKNTKLDVNEGDQVNCATDTSEEIVSKLYATHNASRRKRSTSREHTVELLIVADSKMAAYHGNGLEQYILSLVAVASSIYKDGSLGNMVNIVLVKIRIVEDEKDGPNITSDAQQALSNFCRWQHRENEADDAHPAHYDTAVMLTRVNICRSKGKCGTLGLAELGTVCNPARSCAIIEDNGLSAAFTLAHEIGHVFGVPHDDSEICTRLSVSGDLALRNSYKENQYHLMASTLDYSSETWSWSSCTRKFITKFLDKEENIHCLRDKPLSLIDYERNAEPGQSYDKHRQCEMVYGNGARICPYMPVCKRLWCTLPDNSGCRTQHMPWADGTECGRGKWCQKGFCELKSSKGSPVNGQWSMWDSWSECSRTCGGGIKYAERACDNPKPESGGRYCLGKRRKYKSCNTSPCPAGPNFRDKQCEAYNGRKFNRKEIPANPQYIPHYSEESAEQCKLYCSVRGIQPNYYKMNDRVEDGTKCTKNGLDICVDGFCRPAGCDNVLGSNLKIDICGVCGGDNSTCRMTTVSREAFTREVMTYGYNRVTTLPINASSIEITQTVGQIDENYLALRDSKGSYLFNGNYIVMMYSLEVKLTGGATVEFSGSEQVVERITISGFITQELTLEVLSVGSLQPANVHYSYVLPVIGEVTFQWAINNSWTPCSSECRGKRSQTLICLREQDNLLVNSSHCSKKHKPAVKQEWCNLQCDIRWRVENIEDCSANCGRGFVKRKVTCIKQSQAGIEEIADEKCNGSRPSNIEACSGRCSPTMWRYSSWSSCSMPCGGGTQTREAICTLRNGRKIVNFACKKQEKVISRPCNTEECTRYELSDWGQCSVSCGLGLRSREVLCLEGGKETSLDRCGVKHPPNTQPCQRGPCPDWQISDWTDCSVTCGEGFRYREVTCQQAGKEVDNGYCTERSRPIEVSNCTMSVCPSWSTSNWSACSVSCGGGGVRQRSVECADHQGQPVAVNLCQMDLKPDETQVCSAKETCAQSLHKVFNSLGIQNKKKYIWRYGRWTACSASCGEAVRQRYVRCSALLNPSLQVPDSYCRHEEKPADEQMCDQPACGVWRNGNWSQCSASCDGGMQYRVVVCTIPNSGYAQPSDCDPAHMPTSKRSCGSVRCPVFTTEVTTTIRTTLPTSTRAPDKYWRTGSWTKCSKSCGGGVRRRAVECYHMYSRSIGCSLSSKPADRENCNTHACPKWRTGGWTQCSATCGYGIQERRVVCQLHDGASGNISHCGEPAPDNIQHCVVTPCGVARWNTTAWTQCSVSCGMGTMSREIACVDSANVSLSLDSSLCSPIAKPSTTETCIATDCSRWYYSAWSECSGVCGKSERSRDVWCGLPSKKRLPDDECSTLSKPVSSENCEMEKCLYTWHTMEWSACSSSCGVGQQSRRVVCRTRNGTNVLSNKCMAWPSPSQSQSCNNGECPYWKISPWNQCSVSCGYGKQQRVIECFNITSQHSLPDQLCAVKTKPEGVRDCQEDPCPVWKVQSWGKCSGQCNISTSVQQRAVKCVSAVDFEETTGDACNQLQRPASTRRCQDCSHWEPEEWSRCTETCGVGIQARRLSCVNSRGTKVADDNCSNEPRLKIIRSCQNKPCSMWHTQSWSACSTTCDKGVRTRRVQCVKVNRYEPIPNVHCANTPQPASREICVVNSKCPTWNTSAWSYCSVSCGEGFRKRNVTCDASAGSSCDERTKPTGVETCKMPACHRGFEWKAERWSECSASCGYGVKSRQVKCYSMKSHKQVAIYYCSIRDKPPTQRRCQERHCPFTWWADIWSQCSATCGEGRQFRKVLCKSVSAEGWYLGNSGFGCKINEKPPAIRSCTMGPCYSSYIWQPEPWDKCSSECGWGNERRRIWCVSNTGERVLRSKCNSLYKPERSRKCYSGPCQSHSCSELRRKSSIREDGDYELFIHGKPIKIYCHKMYSKEPEEYITLRSRSSDNYAMVYSQRLANPYICPYMDNRVDSGSCSNCISTKYHRAGETRFTRVRLNITTLSIVARDFEFSQTSGSNAIGFGSAGDCYSAIECPQGRFSINLKGTGFRVASRTKWKLHGTYSFKNIVQNDDGTIVQGKCGGYCGLCYPAAPNGLELDVLANS